MPQKANLLKYVARQRDGRHITVITLRIIYIRQRK
nr:MAG TPA: hypothetical protein [Caudoviricetes sp.]